MSFLFSLIFQHTSSVVLLLLNYFPLCNHLWYRTSFLLWQKKNRVFLISSKSCFHGKRIPGRFARVQPISCGSSAQPSVSETAGEALLGLLWWETLKSDLAGDPQWSWGCSKAPGPGGCCAEAEQVAPRVVGPKSLASGIPVRRNILEVQAYVSGKRHRAPF